MTMRQMKYWTIVLLGWLPFTLTLQGCGKLYTGEELSIVTPDDPDNPDGTLHGEEVPILLAFTDPNYSILTRGQGAFEAGTDKGLQNWDNARFYVYAFRSDNPQGMSFATTRQENKEMCLVDGSTQDTPDLQHGRLARLTERDGGAFFTWVDQSEQLYYSSLAQINPFNFFAYYIDDAVVTNFRRSTDDIRFDLEIDGTQDILGAVARPTEKQLSNIAAIEDEDERENVRKYLYSTYTAHRNFHPVLAMKHYMARLKFEAYPGSDEESIYVQSVKIRCPYSGEFIAAAKDTTQIGLTFPAGRGMRELVLRDTTGLPLPADSFLIAATPDDLQHDYVYDRNPVRLGGGSLLLPPEDEYHLIMELKQHFNDGRPDATYTAEYNICMTGGFKAGTIYTVRIAVFGVEDIQIKVVVTAWKDGGYVDVEPDDGF